LRAQVTFLGDEVVDAGEGVLIAGFGFLCHGSSVPD
jgi:hypothetical protein